VTSVVYELTSVQVRFGPRLALDIDSLVIGGGNLYLLLGPNGAGKSTLLSVLAFLTKPDRGRVTFCGSPVTWSGKQLGYLRKQVTLLHQQSYLFSGTVAANVGFGLRMRDVKQEEIRRSVKEALAQVRLAGFEARDARRLSGGEARRVALARALACRPEVLLLDEPLAYVDQETSDIIEDLIATECHNGTTIVMSIHDEQIAGRLTSSVVRLKDGKLQ
jgi:tungstate transport system ATP-binding protein